MISVRQRAGSEVRSSGRWSSYVVFQITCVLWASALCSQENGFLVPDAAAPAYDGYAVVAGLDVRVGSSTEVNGDVHADEDVEVSPRGGIVGDVSAGGLVPYSAGVSGAGVFTALHCQHDSATLHSSREAGHWH